MTEDLKNGGHIQRWIIITLYLITFFINIFIVENIGRCQYQRTSQMLKDI